MTDSVLIGQQCEVLRLLAEVERLHQELAIRESSEQEKVIDYLGKECVDWEDKYLALAGENAKLLWLGNDMRACFRIGAERDGISKQWCYELFDSYTGKLRELGIEVD